MIEKLRQKANSLPQSPGVYIMKNASDSVIYVGKSKKLKNRVTSYFTGNQHTVKTARMVSLVKDFDYIVCATEIEALTLENTLIKKHSPRYNIKLKDAKSYPYIKVTREDYPKLFVTRERTKDRARYYGPYQSAEAAYGALEAVMKVFGVASCKRSFPKDIGKERPCIYKDMGRCVAPCTGKVESSEYRELVRMCEDVLDGNIASTKRMLEDKMLFFSENMEFERAAAVRDSIRALEKLREKQKVVASSDIDRDVFSLYVSETEGALAMLSVRRGVLVNKNSFLLSLSDLIAEDDFVSLIADYYDSVGVVPREVLLDIELSGENLSLLSEYLSFIASRKVTVRIAERGEGRALTEMARKNAEESARQARLDAQREDRALRRLTELLALSELPKRIEAYDISNIGSEHITASMVVYKDGKMKKSDYRIFNITGLDAPDDYASIRQTLRRRLGHIGDGSLSLGEKPDLILVDGGATHLGVAKEVLAELNLDIDVFGMVKDEFHKTRALVDTEREIAIAREINVYSFIYALQEEAHRFALKNSQGAKRRTLTHSSLEKIKGIGPKKARLLLNAMPLAKIRVASVKELEEIKGISQRDAELIAEHFKNSKSKGVKNA